MKKSNSLYQKFKDAHFIIQFFVLYVFFVAFCSGLVILLDNYVHDGKIPADPLFVINSIKLMMILSIFAASALTLSFSTSKYEDKFFEEMDVFEQHIREADSPDVLIAIADRIQGKANMGVNSPRSRKIERMLMVIDTRLYYEFKNKKYRPII